MHPLRRQLAVLPHEPGIYRYRDASGRLLYVGKTRDLARRVRSYWRLGPDTGTPTPAPALAHRTRRMLAQVARVEVEVTADEQAALALEASIIRAERPRYNVRLREGGRGGVWICLSGDVYPRVLVTHHPPADARAFGPFVGMREARAVARAAERLACMRPCAGATPGRAGTLPCLDWHLGRCDAPCVGRVREADYRARADALADALAGDSSALRDALSVQMHAASAAQDYERAALFRDRRAALERLGGLRPTFALRGPRDAVAVSDEGVCARVSVRDGVVVREQVGVVEDPLGGDGWDARSSWLAARADPAPIVCAASDAARLRAAGVAARGPVGPAEQQLLARARRIAHTTHVDDATGQTESGLHALAELLGLPTLERMECIDISHLADTAVVASVAVAIDGRIDRRQGRVMSLDPALRDDTRRIEAAVRRRLARQGGRDASYRQTPHCLIVDGGPAQLAAAARALGDETIPLLAIAKRNERVYARGHDGPFPLPADSPAQRCLERLRDEAHRLANGYQRRRARAARRGDASTDRR